jgi:hypothetical protein
MLNTSRFRPELAHLVRNVRRSPRPGAHERVRRPVPRGFPVFCCRGGRCGPAVTAAVQPVRLATRATHPATARAEPAAILGWRCCTARAARRTVNRQPLRGAQARPHAVDYPDASDSPGSNAPPPFLAGRQSSRSGGRGLRVQLEQPVPLLPPDRFHLGPGRRFGAPAPRHQRGPGSARPRGQGPLPPPGGPVPGPGHSLRNNRGDTGHPLQRPRGPGPVQTEHQRLPPRRGPAVITSHLGIVAQAARACQAPGLPLPGRCRPAGAARRRCSGPAASALAPRRSSAQPGSPGRAAGPVSPPVPGAEVPRAGDSSSNPGDPVHYDFNLVSAQISST